MPTRPEELAQAYFPDDQTIWSDRGLRRSGELAAAIRASGVKFVHLDAVQLLKHILGLERCHRGRFTLCYLYFDVLGPEGDLHRVEIDRVSALVEGEVPFKALSYQRFVSNLRALAGPSHDPYFRYMKERYGLAGSS